MHTHSSLASHVWNVSKARHRAVPYNKPFGGIRRVLSRFRIAASSRQCSSPHRSQVAPGLHPQYNIWLASQICREFPSRLSWIKDTCSGHGWRISSGKEELLLTRLAFVVLSALENNESSATRARTQNADAFLATQATTLTIITGMRPFHGPSFALTPFLSFRDQLSLSLSSLFLYFILAFDVAGRLPHLDFLLVQLSYTSHSTNVPKMDVAAARL